MFTCRWKEKSCEPIHRHILKKYPIKNVPRDQIPIKYLTAFNANYIFSSTKKINTNTKALLCFQRFNTCSSQVTVIEIHLVRIFIVQPTVKSNKFRNNSELTTMAIIFILFLYLLCKCRNYEARGKYVESPRHLMEIKTLKFLIYLIS